jgi:two-component system OmpR family sensor kinase
MMTITTRLTLLFSAIFGCIIIVVAVVMYLSYARSEYALMDDELRTYGEIIVENIRSGSMTLSEYFDQLDTLSGEDSFNFRPVRAVLVSRDSVVYENTPESLVNILVEKVRAKGGMGPHPGFGSVVVGESSYRYFATVVQHGTSADTFTLLTVSSLDRISQRLGNFRALLLVILPVALLVAAGAGWYMARRALSPVAHITQAAEEISSSSLDRRVPVGNSKDELGNLALVFNQMIARLERTFQSQRQFITDASHDLRTPLAVVQAELELLLQHRSLDKEARETIERSIAEIEQLTLLANDLLLLARLESQQPGEQFTTIRLDELLAESVSSVRRLAEAKSISIRLLLDEPVELTAEPRLLRRAIVNVLDNAITWSPAGSTIKASLGTENNHALVIISDAGPGVPAEELPHLSDRFFRGDRMRSTTGFGLGLAIVKSVLEAHHGRLELESPPQQGMTVRLVLPLA